MKIQINPGPFAAALAVAQTAVKPRSTHPVLEHILLEAEDGRLTVSGTDLESRAWHTVACDVQEPGAVTLPPKALVDFLDAVIPTEPVTLTVGAGFKAELVSGRTRVRAAGLDPEQFPVGQSFAEPSFDATLPAAALATLVRSTAFAAARDDSRPILAGVLFEARDGVLQLAAADGYRLALREEHLDGIPDLSVIVHARMLTQAMRHTEKSEMARLVVDASRSALLVETDLGCWTIRLIDGQFPDFRRIIPVDPPIAVTVAKADLVRASRLTRNMQESVEHNGKSTSTQIARLTVRDGEIDLRSVGSDGDRQADVTIECVRERGDDAQIGFNGGYFRDAVEAIDSEQITIEMVGPASPSVLHAAGPRNGHLQVVMPMHVAR